MYICRALTERCVKILGSNSTCLNKKFWKREREREEIWGVVVRDTTVWRGVVTET
jgi:hypothetical protein